MSERDEGNADRDRAAEEELELVRRLSDPMLLNLSKNRHKGHWGREDARWLLQRCRQELVELEESLDDYDISIVLGEDREKFAEQIRHEAADAANFLAMIVDVTR